MVKRILSVLILLLGATSLVASYQHRIKADRNTSVQMYESRRQIKTEIYYNQMVDSQPDQLEESNLNKSISVTPKPTIVGEKELVSIFSSDLDIKDRDIKQKTKVKYTYKVTSEEKEILERMVEAECTDQSKESKMNVTSVIINRVNSTSFPDDIKSVVFEKHQFSPISDRRYYEVKITKATKQAVEKVLRDGVINEALYFCNPKDIESSKNKRWFENLKYLFTDDSHHSFYTE